MFQTYFKIAWRNIWNNKVYSLTNILGLAIGMCCTILILLWVYDELNWNKFHSNYNQVYRIMANRDFNNTINTDASVPYPMATTLTKSFPEIKQGATQDYGGDIVLKHNETIIKRSGINVSSSFAQLFQWKFLQGSPENALKEPNNILITRSTAKALFGTEDAIGKTIRTDNNTDRIVSAVIEDVPANSSITFDVLTPFNENDPYLKQISNDWVNSFHGGYIEVAPGTNITELNKKINAFASQRNNNNETEYFLHPMSKWRLYADFKDGINTGGMIDYVKLFMIIAGIILLIACVNFMNLSTAKSEKRAREVGIRKTLGSERKQLLAQFYIESLLFSIISFALAMLAVYTFLPAFNTLIDRQINFDITHPYFVVAGVAIMFITAFIAGSYPALYLSSFNPVKVLKGTFLPGKQAAMPRKVLVVLQFSISVLLISSTILVYQQIQHVKGRELGYNPDRLVSIPSSPDANKNVEVIRNELLKTNMVSAVVRTSSPITEIWNFTPAPDWPGKPQDASLIMSAMRSEAGFGETIGTKMVMGRDLTNMPADTTAMLLNEAAVKAMGLKDPIGVQMRYGPRTYTVVGVTKNIVMASPYAPVMPMMILTGRGGGFFQVRIKDGASTKDALAAIEKVFKTHNPQYPFDYKFVDQQFARKFLTEDLISKLTNLFAGLAIFICCLGLAGLTSYTIERRVKEIGIRKVLGASVQHVLYLISKEFLVLVLLAALISIPLAWVGLNNWLENYEYRVNVSIWVFVASCVGVLVVTFLVVWLNAWKAARANPVVSLKSE